MLLNAFCVSLNLEMSLSDTELDSPTLFLFINMKVDIFSLAMKSLKILMKQNVKHEDLLHRQSSWGVYIL